MRTDQPRQQPIITPENTFGTGNTTPTGNTSTSSKTSGKGQAGGQHGSLTMDPPPQSAPPPSNGAGANQATLDVLAPPSGGSAEAMMLKVQGLNSKMSATQQGSAASTIASDQAREQKDIKNYQDKMKKAAHAAKHHGKGFHPFKALNHVLVEAVHGVEHGVKDLVKDVNKVVTHLPGVGPIVSKAEHAIEGLEQDVVKDLKKTAFGRDIVDGVEDAGKMANAFLNNPLETLESLGKEAIGAAMMAVGDEEQGAALFMSGALDMADIALCDSGVLHGKAEEALNIDLKVASAVCMMMAGDPEAEVEEGTEEGIDLAENTGDDAGDVDESGGDVDDDEMGGAGSGTDDEEDMVAEQQQEMRQQDELRSEFRESEEKSIIEDAGDGSGEGDDDPAEAKDKAKEKMKKMRSNTRKAVKWGMRAAAVTTGSLDIYNGAVGIYNGYWSSQAEKYEADATKAQGDFTVNKEAVDADINALKTRMKQYATITKDVSSILNTLEQTKTDTTRQSSFA